MLDRFLYFELETKPCSRDIKLFEHVIELGFDQFLNTSFEDRNHSLFVFGVE